MKRKALAITLAAAMAMGTCAVTASAADGDKYTIGICQLVQHEALDAATQGFKDEVTKELGEDAVTFDEQNAQGDSNTCSTIINSFLQMQLLLFRQLQQEQAIFRFLVLLLLNTVLHLDWMISTGLWAEIFPELQTLLPLISRQQCSMNFSRMQKM